MIKSRGIRLEGYVARIGEKRNSYKYSKENIKEGAHLKDTEVDNIKRSLKKQDGRVWIEFMWLRIGTSGGLLRTW
jgi:hypothetical protein